MTSLNAPRQIVLTAGLLTAVGVACNGAAHAQTTQQMDEEFAREVTDWTTRPEFLSPLVDHLPLVDAVPSPKKLLGYHAGAPRKLTYYAELLEYYQALASASPRVTGVSDENVY